MLQTSRTVMREIRADIKPIGTTTPTTLHKLPVEKYPRPDPFPGQADDGPENDF